MVQAMKDSVFGKLYSTPNNPRAFKALLCAKYNNITLQNVSVQIPQDTQAQNYILKFPMAKVPAFEGSDGFLLFESTAIAYHVAQAKEDTQLLGTSKKDKALIQQYVSFAQNEFGPVTVAWVYPILGYTPNNEQAVQNAKNNCSRALAALNSFLASKTFLVGERVTLADIVLVSELFALFKYVLDPAFVGPYKHVVRWYTTCVNQPEFSSVMGKVELCKKMQVCDGSKPAPVASSPKKEDSAPPKHKKEPSSPKKAAPKPEEEDLEAIAAAEEKPKEKNPLDLLPKSSFILDEWKRFYSNNDTRPTAIDWFWSHVDLEGFSIWKVNYKYNNELTMTFMSSNLIGGFFQRLERARKYAFGSMLVLGVDKKNEIAGVFVFRGQGIPQEVQEAADFESYNFTRLDTKDAKQKEMFNQFIAWESVGGKPVADGKVFK